MTISWKVTHCTTDELEDTLNLYEQNEYIINRYDPIGDTYKGTIWIVVGYTGKPNTLKEDPYQSVR
jgi:hypothetical protein